jgi:hypothetical protein
VIRLYHPNLGTEIEAGDEAQAAVYAASGWLPAPERPEPRPGYEPEQISYVQGDDGLYRPEEPEPEPEPEPPAKAKRASKAVKAEDDPES